MTSYPVRCTCSPAPPGATFCRGGAKRTLTSQPISTVRAGAAPLLDRHARGPERPPILLTRPGYASTLAATRCLGARGVPVMLAGAGLLDPARWSRFARPSAAPSDPEALVSWLLHDA